MLDFLIFWAIFQAFYNQTIRQMVTFFKAFRSKTILNGQCYSNFFKSSSVLVIKKQEVQHRVIFSDLSNRTPRYGFSCGQLLSGHFRSQQENENTAGLEQEACCVLGWRGRHWRTFEKSRKVIREWQQIFKSLHCRPASVFLSQQNSWCIKGSKF